MSGDKLPKDKMDSVDQVSQLPEFILHNILSFLDAKEACRASVLSKKWYAVWSSIPVLDFQPQYFKKGCSAYPGKYMKEFYDTETLLSYMGFINKTMERYYKQKHGIRKFRLEVPVVHEILEPLFDNWIGIAVRNKVQELEITILIEELWDYKLPEILFCARSLKVLKCNKVKLPNYQTMKLLCLEYLILNCSTIDDDMLQRIISFCPLIDLQFRGCSCLKNVSISWMKKLPEDEMAEDFGSGTPHSNLKTSTLKDFFYLNHFQCPWPWNVNVAALKNLRKLEIISADITDDIVSELVSGLAGLETLFLSSCLLLKCLKISSISLKKISIVGCFKLEKLTIDFPNLLFFRFNADFKLAPSIINGNTELKPALSIINVLDHCDAHLFAWAQFPNAEWFVKLKEFLVGTNIFKSLGMNMGGCEADYQFEVDEEHLRKINIGTSYKLREFELDDTCDWVLEKSSLSAFLDVLFWTCHPDVLSIPTSFQNTTVELILDILKEKVHCWKDPLKSIEVEGVEFPHLLSYSPQLKIRLKLCW